MDVYVRRAARAGGELVHDLPVRRFEEFADRGVDTLPAVQDLEPGPTRQDAGIRPHPIRVEALDRRVVRRDLETGRRRLRRRRWTRVSNIQTG